jgi:hypothetical protein
MAGQNEDLPPAGGWRVNLKKLRHAGESPTQLALNHPGLIFRPKIFPSNSPLSYRCQVPVRVAINNWKGAHYG